MPGRRRATPTADPAPVESLEHADKRVNIPTADAKDFVSAEAAAVAQVRYPRDPSLDPQMVWKGKDAADADDLVADAPPIYIQEKIVPRALVEDLRRPGPEQASLFDDFDGLDGDATVEFYEHSANWSNRLILGDSLQVMASLAEKENLRGQVQMIYFDPPYGIRFGSNWQVSTRKREVKDGKVEDATHEVEQIKAFRDTWELGIHSYLAYLRDRLAAARDLLTDSGSCFVQIGDENVHLVRSVMDEVFGSENFVSQITVTKTTSATAEHLPGISDYVLLYARDANLVKFRKLWLEARDDRTGYNWVQLGDNTRRPAAPSEIVDEGLLPEGSRLYKPDNITSQRPPGSFEVIFEGKVYTRTRAYWKTGESGMQRLIKAYRIHSASTVSSTFDARMTSRTAL